MKYLTDGVLIREMMDDPLLSQYRCEGGEPGGCRAMGGGEGWHGADGGGGKGRLEGTLKGEEDGTRDYRILY